MHRVVHNNQLKSRTSNKNLDAPIDNQSKHARWAAIKATQPNAPEPIVSRQGQGHPCRLPPTLSTKRKHERPQKTQYWNSIAWQCISKLKLSDVCFELNAKSDCKFQALTFSYFSHLFHVADDLVIQVPSIIIWEHIQVCNSLVLRTAASQNEYCQELTFCNSLPAGQPNASITT